MSDRRPPPAGRADLCTRCGQPLTRQDRPARPGEGEAEVRAPVVAEGHCARCGASLLPTKAAPPEPHGIGLAVGDVLEGKWRIDGSLGSGGMGSVFLAQDLGLDRKVAIKVLAPKFAADPGFAARFEREAQATAKLEHPNIVPIYAVGRHQDWPFIVMKALEGTTLSRLLRERMAAGAHLSREEVLAVFGPLCGALAFLHAKGYVHRDVKPANVFVGSHGHVTLLDFGVLHDSHAERLTLNGMQLGTPVYASPEQLSGARDVDPRADVYALGVMLYEILAQRLPYSGDSITLMQFHAAPPPPLADLVQSLPAGVAATVHRALSMRPADRFRSASEFYAALEQAWASPPASASLVPPDARPTLPADFRVERPPEPPPGPRLSTDSLVRAAGMGRKVPVVAIAVAGVLALVLAGLGLWLRRTPSVEQIPDPRASHRRPRQVVVPPPIVAEPGELDGGRDEERVKRPEGDFKVPVF